MDENNEIEFLRMKNDELILELSNKITENEILLKMKNVLEMLLKECDCHNRLKSEMLFKTLKLFRQHRILVDMIIKNKGKHLKYKIQF